MDSFKNYAKLLNTNIPFDMHIDMCVSGCYKLFKSFV